MRRYPLKLSAVGKTALWGGSRLREQYGMESTYEKLAEAWVLTVRPGAVNVVCNGEAAGMTLSAYLEAVGYGAVSPEYNGENFPLLIKLIDAADRLSVQVHPDDAYAHAHGLDSGKTEMWYVVDADPGASLLLGLKPGVSAEQFAEGVASGDPVPLLREVPVHPGDCFYIPAGMLHAIGAGILIAEIQQNSDTTYRVWDYARRDSTGCLRPLHIREALETMRPISDGETEALRFSRAGGKQEPALLAAAEFFTVRKVCAPETFSIPADTFRSFLLLSGTGELCAGGDTVALRAGDAVFLPAGIPDCTLSGDLRGLLSGV